MFIFVSESCGAESVTPIDREVTLHVFRFCIRIYCGSVWN